MTNRTAAVVITILVVLFFGCPGILFLCNGVLALVEILSQGQIQIYGYDAPYWLAGSLCVGVIAIVITVLVSYFVLRQRKSNVPPPTPTMPTPPEEPLPPTI